MKSFIASFVVLLIIGCSNNQRIIEPKENMVTEFRGIISKTDSNMILKFNPTFYQRAERCMGQCATYYFYVMQNREAFFIGEANTFLNGHYVTKLADEDFAALVEMASSHKLKSFVTPKDKVANDISAISSYVRYEDMSVYIYNMGNAPENVNLYQQNLYRFIQELDWKVNPSE